MSLDRSDVTPIPKTTRPWVCGKDDADCTRAKPCRSCLGKRSRRSGLRKQRMAQRGMGIPMTMFRGANGNEELWSGPWRVEVKSGAQVGPIATRYLSAEAQMEAAKRIGDTRPGFVVAMPSGWGSEGLLICRLSRFQAVVDAAIEWSQNQ